MNNNKKSIVLILFFVLGSFAINQSFGQRIFSTYTPNGTYVSGSSYGQLASWECTNYVNDVNNNYPGAGILRPPTNAYNCHGYGWHMSNTAGANTSVKIWINTPSNLNYLSSAYGGDNSYAYQSTECGGCKAHYYSGDHSAVVLTQTGGSLIYRSKWGAGPLVLHQSWNVPSVYNSWAIRWFKRNGYGNAEAIQLNKEVSESGDCTLSWTLNQDLGEVSGFNILRKNGEEFQRLNEKPIVRQDFTTTLEKEESYSLEIPGVDGDVYLELIGSDVESAMVKF